MFGNSKLQYVKYVLTLKMKTTEAILKISLFIEFGHVSLGSHGGGSKYLVLDLGPIPLSLATSPGLTFSGEIEWEGNSIDVSDRNTYHLDLESIDSDCRDEEDSELNEGDE